MYTGTVRVLLNWKAKRFHTHNRTQFWRELFTTICFLEEWKPYCDRLLLLLFTRRTNKFLQLMIFNEHFKVISSELGVRHHAISFILRVSPSQKWLKKVMNLSCNVPLNLKWFVLIWGNSIHFLCPTWHTPGASSMATFQRDGGVNAQL